VATTIYPKYTKTFYRAPNRVGMRDMLSVNSSSSVNPWGQTTSPVESPFVAIVNPDLGSGIVWYSERVAAQVTISGQITVNIGTTLSTGTTARLRVRLSKLSASGNIETPIVDYTHTSNIAINITQNTLTMTPPVPITLAPFERFVYRPSIVPVDGSYGATPQSVEHRTNSGSPTSSIVFTETFTFMANGYVGYMRDTKATGVGAFRDLLLTRGSAMKVGLHGPTEGSDIEQPMKFPDIAVREVVAARIQSTANAASYASATHSVIQGMFYLLAVVHSDAAPESTVPTVSSDVGLTFTQVGSSMPFSTIASPGLRLTVFRSVSPTSHTSTTMTINFADAATGCAAVLVEVTGLLTTGTNGADAVRNVSTNSNNASANPSVTMGAFNDTDNATIMFLGTNIATAPTGGTGMTMKATATYATPTGAVAAAFNRANDSAPDMVLASSAWAAIAIELVQSPEANAIYEWITPRFAAPGWTFDLIDLLQTKVYMGVQPFAVSGDSLGGAVKIFRRKPDGTELLVATISRNAAFTTSSANIANATGYTATLHQPTNFEEDDRAVMRPYIRPVSGAMSAGFVYQVSYDHPSEGTNGSSWVALYDTPRMKLESDPDKDPLLLDPGGMSMLGTGM
jgi:hypothetical protein